MASISDRLSSIAESDFRRHFEITSSALTDWRLDSEPHAPIYRKLETIVKNTTFGCQLSDVASVGKPHGRYKTYYVDDPQHGLPILSGRQIAQYRPVALKHISPLSFSDPEEYKLEAGWLVMTADGRAEENLADCSLITEDRAGWTASGHVHRIKPKSGINSGLLYLACTADIVQARIKALATGSVVDALSESDLRKVTIPYPPSPEACILGNEVLAAWRDFDNATKLEDNAIQTLEDELST